jgi:neutral ceramidase
MPDSSRSEGGVWVIHADDGDTHTTFCWERQGTFRSVVTIEWQIPQGTPRGRYRIKVNGDFKHFIWRTVTPYAGVSSAFQVVGVDA